MIPNATPGLTARYVADEAALREAVGKHTPVWEYNDLGFRLDCGCDKFTHGGVDRAEAERRFAEHLIGALSNVVQPRGDAVREAKAEALRETAAWVGSGLDTGSEVRDVYRRHGVDIWLLGLAAALTPTTPGTDRPAAEDGPRNTGTGSAT